MKAGISSYTYTWSIGVPGKEPEKPMAVYQLIEKAAEFGIEVVQIADNLPLDSFEQTELLKIRNYAEDLNVHVEVGARKMTSENLEKYIGLAVFFKSPILRFVIDGKDFEPDLTEVHTIIKKAVPILEEHNIVLAIENHDRFSSQEFVEMIRKSKSEHVRICLDSVNSMGAGEGLESVIKKLAPLTINFHVKEFKIERVYHKMGFVIEGCPLGDGMLPLKKMIKAVPENCGSAILEQWTPPEKDLNDTIIKEHQWAEKSIQYLKNVLEDF